MSTKRVLWLSAIYITSQISILLVPQIGLAGRGNLTILHTNDLHSHLSEFARLASMVKEIREEKAKENGPVLLLDSGDFTVGTLYHLLTPTLSPELTLMSSLGYDATTLGNHEFDWGPQALVKLIDIARTNRAASTVPIIASNIRFNLFDCRDNDLKKLSDAGVIRPYLIKTLSNGLKVGIIGLLGKEAEQESPQAAPVGFSHTRDFIQHIVDLVRSKGVDLVILLSHSGLKEDKKLAKLIEGIDIIVAAHCHTPLFQPIHIGNTLIVEAGSYAQYLGKLEVLVDEGKVSLRSYQLIPIDDTIPQDEAIQRIINEYQRVIDRTLSNPIGLAFSSPLAQTSFDLRGETGAASESNLGDLITDGMRFSIDRYQPEDSVDFTFQPTGFIRGSIDTGTIRFSHAFSVVSLGTSADKLGGYSLVSFYLNAQEIKRTLEISIYLSLTRGRRYLLQVSGLRFWYNPLRPIFRKVTRIEQWDPTSSQYIPLATSDRRTLYKVGTNLLLVDLLTRIRPYLPWLTIVPKDRYGKPIPLSTSRGRTQILVDREPINRGVQELKEWQALTEYFSHLPDLDGDLTPDIPARYAQPQKRINKPSEEVLSYWAQRKSPLVGVGAALVFPSLGHLYARDWYPRGLKFLLMELGSLFLASQKSMRTPGLLALAAVKLWECGDAHEAVINFNKKLAEKYRITFSLDQNKVSVGLSYRF